MAQHCREQFWYAYVIQYDKQKSFVSNTILDYFGTRQDTFMMMI